MITPEKWEKLHARMDKLKISEADLSEQFIRGSGKGGQKVNKTSSCVYLHHAPSGLDVRCQRSRLQASNRYFARRDLCEKLAEKILGTKSQKQQEREKIRRQKRRRSRGAKNRMLDEKSKRGDKKALRRPVKDE